MKKKFLPILLIGILVVILSSFLFACDKNDNNSEQPQEQQLSDTVKIGENGNWFINGIDTTVKAQGEKGEKGDAGKSAYQLYKDTYGYEGTEQEWLNDLLNGNLATSKYTVTFDSNGGSKVPSQEVDNNKKASKPSNPTRTGYDFDGWYVADEQWNFLAYLVTDDITLKAKWTPHTCEVTFDSNEGNEIENKTYTFGGEYTLPTPTRTDYVFLGWYDGETLVNQSGEWNIDQETLEVEAKWELVSYLITFDVQGGKTLPQQKVYIHASYTLPTPEKENHSFVGWYYNETLYSEQTELTGDITLVAKWEGATDAFTYSNVNDEITITEYKGTSINVVIPATIGDIPVTQIATGVFTNNTTIESVSFDGTFANYTQGMFAGCTALKKLIISGVYDQALYYLFGEDIDDIPESFVEIEFAKNSIYTDGSLFKNCGTVCNHTVSLKIPDGTTKINYGQFKGYSNLQSVIIPNSVTSIGSEGFSSDSFGAFYGCSSLTSVTIGNSVTIIGFKTFYDCSNLTSITIPDSVTSIGDSAFNGCSSLATITIGNSVTVIGSSAFVYCSSLSSITIPDSVDYIGSGAFSNCSSLACITIPDNVTSIGSSAFYNCSSLTRVTLGSGLKELGDRVFPDSVKTKKDGLYYVDTWVVGVVNTSITTASIATGTKGIAASAFSNCSSLASITIPDSVTSIGSNAFSSCSSLTRATLGNGLKELARDAFPDSVKTGKSGLYYVDTWVVGVVNTSITRATIENGTKGIAASAFSGCICLTSITIPNSVTSIGSSAFSGCSSLTSITIPDSVTSIGIAAFPDSVKTGKSGLYYVDTWVVGVVNTSITTATIKNSIKGIATSAFDDCSSLATVYYQGSDDGWNEINISIGGNSPLTSATRYYYSEEEPTVSGNYWHYDTDGVTVVEW